MWFSCRLYLYEIVWIIELVWTPALSNKMLIPRIKFDHPHLKLYRAIIRVFATSILVSSPDPPARARKRGSGVLSNIFLSHIYIGWGNQLMHKWKFVLQPVFSTLKRLCGHLDLCQPCCVVVYMSWGIRNVNSGLKNAIMTSLMALHSPCHQVRNTRSSFHFSGRVWENKTILHCTAPC